MGKNKNKHKDDGKDTVQDENKDKSKKSKPKLLRGFSKNTISSDKKESEDSDGCVNTVKHVKVHQNALETLSNLKHTISKWRDYVTTRHKQNGVTNGNEKTETGGLGLEYDPNVKDEGHSVEYGLEHQHQMRDTESGNLIEYFARIGQDSKDGQINLDYVKTILDNGGNVNCGDKYGQTVFHEVARAWHVDIGRFLVENGADVNQADIYGRTPLHVAAAVNYPQMVKFLIDNGADKEALTRGENQTPLYYAASHDACKALKALIKLGCEYKYVRDYKHRTPLQVAAELDRSETTRFLLELADPAPAGVEDHSGQAAIAWMICKMPPVAKIALDQFHTTDRANRKQAYHLNKLEPRKPDDTRKGHPQSPMQCIVRFKRFDLIEHPAILFLINIKWKKFGRLGAIKNTLFNLTFILLWTFQAVLVEYDVRYLYVFPSQWWRIVLFILSLMSTGWQVKEELTEYISSRRAHNKWEAWRLGEIDMDMKYAHPRWPEEADYLTKEKKTIINQKPQYFNDFWNVFDWICYFLLFVCIVTHLVDIGYHTNFVARLHIRIMSVTIIIIWIRLLKNARAFSYLGPFIVMITHMMADVLKFLFLYFQFFIPFACAFWMLFGGTKVPEKFQGRPDADNNTVTVIGMDTVDAMLFSLFRITLVDDYDYDGMKSIDYLMADLLVGGWMALSAILMLNLFIALLSDTFQRVYNNAKANAVMQKAITIMGTEEGLTRKRRDKFLRFIHNQCNPKEESYDDDVADLAAERNQQTTTQIKEQLDVLEHKLHMGVFSGNNFKRQTSLLTNKQVQIQPAPNHDHTEDCAPSASNDSLNREIIELKRSIENIQRNQEKIMSRFKKDVNMLKDLLLQNTVTSFNDDDDEDTMPLEESTPVRRKQEFGSYSSGSRPANMDGPQSFAQSTRIDRPHTAYGTRQPPTQHTRDPSVQFSPHHMTSTHQVTNSRRRSLHHTLLSTDTADAVIMSPFAVEVTEQTLSPDHTTRH